MSYDVPFNPNYASTSPYPTTQTAYGSNSVNFSPDIYSGTSPNVALNGGQFYTTQHEFPNATHNQIIDTPKRSNWDHMVSSNI